MEKPTYCQLLTWKIQHLQIYLTRRGIKRELKLSKCLLGTVFVQMNRDYKKHQDFLGEQYKVMKNHLDKLLMRRLVFNTLHDDVNHYLTI